MQRTGQSVPALLDSLQEIQTISRDSCPPKVITAVSIELKEKDRSWGTFELMPQGNPVRVIKNRIILPFLYFCSNMLCKLTQEKSKPKSQFNHLNNSRVVQLILSPPEKIHSLFNNKNIILSCLNQSLIFITHCSSSK
jgi:hypothetical protein